MRNNYVHNIKRKKLGDFPTGRAHLSRIITLIPPKRDEKFLYKHFIPARRDELFH